MLYFGQCGAVFYGLQHGVAKSNHIAPPDGLESSGRVSFVPWHVRTLYADDLCCHIKAFLASEILALLGLSLSKCSCLVLIMRVLRPVKFGVNVGWGFCILSLILSAVWGIASALGVGIGCDGGALLSATSGAACPAQHLRWQVITAVDVATDVLISLIPALLVAALHMPLQDKFDVCAAFGFRLAAVPFSVLHLNSIADLVGSADPPLASTFTLVMQQVMLFCSLLGSTVPNLKGFMSSFSTGMGVKMFQSEAGTSQSHRSYALQTIGGSSTLATPKGGGGGEGGGVMSPKYGNSTRIFTVGDSAHNRMGCDGSASQETVNESGNVSRRGSEELIIRKTDL